MIGEKMGMIPVEEAVARLWKFFDGELGAAEEFLEREAEDA